MQDYISDSNNEDRVYRFKQALLNLDRWDFSEGPIEVPAGGYVEPFPGQDYTVGLPRLLSTVVHKTSK
jgi:hypothetical protein